jgi:hypothetical protein
MYARGYYPCVSRFQNILSYFGLFRIRLVARTPEAGLVGRPATPAKPIDFLRKEANMKRLGLWAIGVAALALAGPIATHAGENGGRCTRATLHGQYLFTTSGTLFPPAFGVKTKSTATSAGYHIFNGDGTGTDYVTFSVNGIDQDVPSPVATTYTVKDDCTGTYSVQNGPSFDIFVAIDGSALSVIDIGQGVAISEGPDIRVGSSSSAQ